MKLALVATIAAFAGCGNAWAAGTSCDGLKNINLAHTEITVATLVEKGAFTPPPNPQQMQMGQPQGAPGGGQAGPGGPGGPGGGGGRAQNNPYKNVPAFCRIEATLRPSADSEIKMALWMPVDGWTGRLAEAGNGGFAGNIGYNNLAGYVTKGYAGTVSNTGHDGGANALIGHPEKLIDWGYRAVHETTVTAKALIAAYYGTPAKYSYWDACSTGGREGWMAAEYYPDDFNGYAIGDPANPMTRLQSGSIWTNRVVQKDAASFINAAKFQMIHDAVLKQCDGKDGVVDGLIQDPMVCNFDPNTLLCKNGDADTCLTAQQIDSLNKIAQGAVSPTTGKNFYPGWPMATRQFPGPVLGNKQGADPQGDAIDTFRVLFQDANWDYHTMDFDKDIAKSDKMGEGLMNATDQTKIKPIFDKGGKILLYHGWADPNITPLISVQYYNSAVESNGGLAKTYNEIRLFMVPGMGHCGGGDGPNAFDKLDVISDWVEKGKAPDSIIATHTNSQGFVDRTRPLCPYPQVAKYKGSGNINDAENFVCAAP
jgi:feruloyl esterase